MDDTIIDLFSGAGIMAYGFHTTFPIIQAIDWKEVCCRSYKMNFPDTQVSVRDILDMFFVKQDFQGVIGIIGGPPCQDFSMLNTKRDSKSERANLLYEFVRVVDEIKPTFFLLENVARVPREMKSKITRQFRSLGYNVISKVINASDYGSVQIRRRWITTGCMTKHVFPSRANRVRKAKEILDSETESEFSMTEETLESIQKIREIGKWVALPNQRYKAYCVIDPDRPVPAVANPTKLRYIRPDRESLLSLRELKRCFDIPDSFCIEGTLSEKSQQIANGFPASVAHRFSLAFKNTLELN